MNLNDTKLYNVVIFKRKLYYQTREKMLLRDVMLRLTKDGVRPNTGIQEIFLVEDMSQVQTGIMFREQVRQAASHSFTVKGYQNRCLKWMRVRLALEMIR